MNKGNFNTKQDSKQSIKMTTLPKTITKQYKWKASYIMVGWIGNKMPFICKHWDSCRYRIMEEIWGNKTDVVISFEMPRKATE